MADLIPFPARPLRVAENDTPATTVSAHLGVIRSFILAMGSSVDPLQIKRDIHVRQGKTLEEWTNESVEHLGNDVVIEMLESMLLHLKKDKRDA